MIRRNCGCRDDSIDTKKSLLRTFKNARIADNGKTIYIGVVFHICFNNYNKIESEADADYTIETLNKDFNKQCANFDYGNGKYTDSSLQQTYQSYVSRADLCNIQFYKVDIKHTPVSSQTSSNTSILDKNIKGASPSFEPNKYLNIWISDFNNGLLGYAQFPWDNLPKTDGVVISKDVFGRNAVVAEYNLNKTVTHEVGHWLGLYHTFQDTFAYDGGDIDYKDGTPSEDIQELKGDCISDTPPQGKPTYGNPFETLNTWPTSKPIDESQSYRHMFMNYMDYSDDIAMFMFTRDQTIKIRQMVHLYRPDILKNNPPPVSIPEPVPTPIPVPEPTPVPTPVPVPEPTPVPIPTPVPEPTPEPTSVPVPTPELIPELIPEEFSSIHYYFENKIQKGWIGNLELINNNLLKTNIQVTKHNPYGGSKCLRTKKSGRGQLKADLSGLKNVILTLYIKSNNPNTYVWVKPPGSKWYTSHVPVNNKYRSYTFVLPKPFDSVEQDHYTIRFGTDGLSTKYSYFDNISIVNLLSSSREMEPDNNNKNSETTPKKSFREKLRIKKIKMDNIPKKVFII